MLRWAAPQSANFLFPLRWEAAHTVAYPSDLINLPVDINMRVENH